ADPAGGAHDYLVDEHVELVGGRVAPPEVDVVPHLADAELLAGTTEGQPVLPEHPLVVEPGLDQPVGSPRRVHPDMALDAGPSPLGQRLGEDPLVSAVALLVQVVDVDADRDLV